MEGSPLRDTIDDILSEARKTLLYRRQRRISRPDISSSSLLFYFDNICTMICILSTMTFDYGFWINYNIWYFNWITSMYDLINNKFIFDIILSINDL